MPTDLFSSWDQQSLYGSIQAQTKRIHVWQQVLHVACLTIITLLWEELLSYRLFLSANIHNNLVRRPKITLNNQAACKKQWFSSTTSLESMIQRKQIMIRLIKKTTERKPSIL